MRYPFQFTSRLISHRNEWLFRIYIIPSQNFVPERNSRSGTTTEVNPHQGDSPRHDLWWWYHETNTEPQEGTGVILDVSYWRCGGVPSERMKSSPGVEPRTCRCWVRARIGKRSRFPVQGLLDDWHQLDCDGLALTPIWALVTFDTPQHTLWPKATNQRRRQIPPQCEGTGLLKGKPLRMNGGDYQQDDSRNGWTCLHWLEELSPKEIGYCPEHRNPRSGVGPKHQLS